MTGKVKEVYRIDNDTLEFVYTDNISVFDKIIPSKIAHKGEALCRTTKYWFDMLSSKGIKNHYISSPQNNRMRVKQVNIIDDYSKINSTTTNYLIPLEIISRYYVAGSLFDRLRSGKIKAEDLGFDAGHMVKHGDKLPFPIIECTTKLEKYDRNITNDDAKKIAGLTDDEFEKIKNITLKVDDIINKEACKHGLIHCDGKKEFAFDKDREIMVVDTLGTLDEDRWWDASQYSDGNILELSKEFIRQYYRRIGYHDALYFARDKGMPEPDIPALPEEMIDRVSKLYINMYKRITGESFYP